MIQVHVISSALGVLALLLVVSCSEKQEPEKESKIGLEQAIKGVERAEEGFKRMREKGESLQQKIDEQTKLLDATMAKHLSILKGRADGDEKLIAGLSTEKQTVLLPMMSELKQQVTAVEAAFRECREAPSAKAEEFGIQLQKTLGILNAAFAELDAKQREPKAEKSSTRPPDGCAWSRRRRIPRMPILV